MDMAAGPYQASSKSLAARFQRQFAPYSHTHDFCNKQAIEILKNDGFRREAVLLEQYLNDINAGVAWADQNWAYTSHYYNPFTGRGLRGWSTALESCTRFFWKAESCLSDSFWEKAFFYLGAAAHLVQDLCVPYHARNIILCGHQQYERWVAKRAKNYSVFSGGIYNEAYREPGDWVAANARISHNYINEVKSPSTSGYHLATVQLLARTQRSTAGFFYYFLSNFQKMGGPVPLI